MSRSQSSSESIGYSSDNRRCHCNGSFAASWNYCPYCGQPINVGISRESTVLSCGTTTRGFEPSHETTGGFEPSHETTGISIGLRGCESGWTKDIGTSIGLGSGTDGTSHS